MSSIVHAEGGTAAERRLHTTADPVHSSAEQVDPPIRMIFNAPGWNVRGVILEIARPGSQTDTALRHATYA
jgi:hypothetical protein